MLAEQIAEATSRENQPPKLARSAPERAMREAMRPIESWCSSSPVAPRTTAAMPEAAALGREM